MEPRPGWAESLRHRNSGVALVEGNLRASVRDFKGAALDWESRQCDFFVFPLLQIGHS